MSIKQVFENIVELLSEEAFFEDYKYRKFKSSFCKKVKDGEISISLGHKCYSEYGVVITPSFSTNFKLLRRWLSKHTSLKKSDFANGYTLRWRCDLFTDKFRFDFAINDMERWDNIYASLRDTIKKGVIILEERYSSIEKWYESELHQYIIDKERLYRQSYFERSLEELAAVKICDPENYTIFCDKVIDNFNWFTYKCHFAKEYGRPIANFEPFIGKLDGIISDLDNTDFSKL